MPDISMCSRQYCPDRYKCYRWCAIPDRWQAYTGFEYTRKQCMAFIANRVGDRLRKDIDEAPIRR